AGSGLALRQLLEQPVVLLRGMPLERLRRQYGRMPRAADDGETFEAFLHRRADAPAHVRLARRFLRVARRAAEFLASRRDRVSYRIEQPHRVLFRVTFLDQPPPAGLAVREPRGQRKRVQRIRGGFTIPIVAWRANVATSQRLWKVDASYRHAPRERPCQGLPFGRERREWIVDGAAGSLRVVHEESHPGR